MQKKTSILFRKSLAEESEFLEAKKHFSVFENRCHPELKDKLIIGRYSVLPFYKELETDLSLIGSSLINSFIQHEYIADFKYYDQLKKYTPKTYFDLVSVPKTGGPFIVKGRTNSRKFQWKEKMFAPDFASAVKIYCELSNDPLIGDQGVIIRDYVSLDIREMGITGLPMANEWRFFFYRDQIVSYGFYWSMCQNKPKTIENAGIDFAKKMARLISPFVNFFVIDISKTENGDWIVIECNDGQQSGLSDNNPSVLYENLSKLLK